MKKMLSLALASSLGVVLCSADPKAEVQAAAKSLAQKGDYSWTTTREIAGANFNMPALQGKVGKDGIALLTQEFNENTATAVLRGDKGVLKTDEGWKTAEELGTPQAGGGGGRGMMGRMLLRAKTPADEVEGLLAKVKELKAGDQGLYSGELTEAGVKELVTFRRGQGATNRPEPKNAKGSVKFWVKNGMLTQYELNVQATITFGQDNTERDMNQTTKVEIKDVGTTKVTVPEEAKKKLTS